MTFLHFSRSINCKFFEYCNPSLLTTLRESTLRLDEKWSKAHESLLEVLASIRKSEENGLEAVDESLIQVADDLDELKISETRKLSSMSTQDETPLLDEFRTAFQEVSRWINKAEAQLGTNRASQERVIGQEIDEWAPKMGDLRKMAEKLVQLFVNQRQDVEPEMASLHLRWEHIVKEVEKRIKANQAFRMVEVEEIKTTISHLSIPLSEPVVTVTQPSPIVDPDEEIETLIEDEPITENNGIVKASDKTSAGKIRFKSNYIPADSSSESLSSETARNTSSSMIVTKSPPPAPLPKPRWYLEQRAQGVKMPLSPERVTVIQNTLPSPQKLIGTVETAASTERQMPEKAVLFSNSTTPSTTLDSPSSTTTIASSTMLEDDVLLARENAVIDHLLAETELQLEEVAKHVRGLATVKDKEQQDIEEKSKLLIGKIEAASRKIDDIENEQDLQLRRDLVSMEVKVLEAEVTSTVSHGDKLASLAKRSGGLGGGNGLGGNGLGGGNSRDHESLVGHVTDLKNVWKTLQSRTEEKKAAILEAEVRLKQFRKELDQLKRWLSSAKVKLVRLSSPLVDEKVIRQFMAEVKLRKSEVDHLNLLASQLQYRNALSGQEMALNIINSDWEEIVERVKGLTPKNPGHLEAPSVVDNCNKLLNAPGSPLMKSAPVEVGTRMAKMMDALAAIDRQLDTQTLASERPCENLTAQSEALATVKNALDRLRPTLKQTDQDLDRLSTANLSMEYFEKLSNSNSKLHKEWDRVRYRYAQRQELWNSSKRLETELQSRKHQLQMWLRNMGNGIESSNMNVTNEEIENKGKLAAELTAFCKEFMSKTNAQEAVALQAEVDALLRQWRSILAVLTSERKATLGLCEKVDKMSLLMNKTVNASDKHALKTSIHELTEAQKEIGLLRGQLSRKVTDEGIRHDPSLLKARTTVERLAVNVPRRLESLKEKEQRLCGLKEKRMAILTQIEDLAGQVGKGAGNPERQQDTFKTVQLGISNLQYEVNRLLNDFVCLEGEVSSGHQSVEAKMASDMQNFKTAWLQLTLEARQLACTTTDASPRRPTDLSMTSEAAHETSTITSPHSTYSITNESCVSPTTCSQSSFLSDDSQLDFDELAAQIEKEMQQILDEATQLNLAVHDPVAIRAVVDQQQQVRTSYIHYFLFFI